MSLADTKKITVKSLVDLLNAKGVSLDDIGRIRSVKAWQGFYKDNEGDAHTVDMSGIEFIPGWEDGPEWPVIDKAKPVKITPRKIAKPKGDTKSVFVFPDTQIGYWEHNGNLIPMHDTGAIDVATQMMWDANPTHVGFAGDTIDLADFSTKFMREPTLQYLTQPALDFAHKWLSICRAGAPHADMDMMEGNHDARLISYIIGNAQAAFGLRRADTTPESWPVLSMPYLLRMDELGLNYLEGFPAAMRWYRDDLVLEHGKSVNTKSLAKKSAISRIMGHNHRLEVQSHTIQTGRDSIARTLTFATGTLSRVDGAVPSFGSGTDSSGRPVRNVEDWAQGCTLISYDPEPGGPITYEIMPISDGVGMFRGERYQAGKWFDPVEPL